MTNWCERQAKAHFNAKGQSCDCAAWNEGLECCVEKQWFKDWLESKLSEKSLGIVYEPGKTLEAGVEYITIKVSDFQAELSKAKQEAYEEVIHFIENHPDIAGGHILTKHIRSKFLIPKS